MPAKTDDEGWSRNNRIFGAESPPAEGTLPLAVHSNLEMVQTLRRVEAKLDRLLALVEEPRHPLAPTREEMRRVMPEAFQKDAPKMAEVLFSWQIHLKPMPLADYVDVGKPHKHKVLK